MSVYFAQVGRYIKVGYSDNPERRVRNLFASTTRYGRPHDCPLEPDARHLIRYVGGSKTTERLVQEALVDFCVGLEWFIDEPAVRDFIANVKGNRRTYKRLHRAEGPHERVPQWLPEKYRATPDAEDEAWARFNANFAAMFEGADPWRRSA